MDGRRAQGFDVPAGVALRKKALSTLRRFVMREGHVRMPLEHIEDGFPLGRWVARKRSDAKRGRLARDLARRLEAVPGWTWQPYEDAFRTGLELLKRFARREGHCAVPGSHLEEGFALGVWVSCRRQERRLGRLRPDRASALEALPDWTWSGNARSGERFRHG